MLFGNNVDDTEILGAKADRMSRGHRFESDKPVWINHPGDYAGTRCAPRACRPTRSRLSRTHRARGRRRGEQAGGDARIGDGVLEQVVCLTEWPTAVPCSFEPDFAAVPQEALIETMEINQKFFPVLRHDGRLTEHFIGVANIESKDVAEVRKGYERVIRPRFADAKFFFDEDLKQGLVSMGEGLKTVTYQAKLGSVADKVQRVAALAETIAKEVGVDPAQRAARRNWRRTTCNRAWSTNSRNCRGIAGPPLRCCGGRAEGNRAGDRRGLPAEVCRRHIALSPLGKVCSRSLNAATRSRAGSPAGLKPTGNKDPFALRRNALGLARR